MGQVLIGSLDDDVLEKFHRQADENHRSLEGELREILLEASRRLDAAEGRRLAEEMRRSLSVRVHGDSGELIREDRER